MCVPTARPFTWVREGGQDLCAASSLLAGGLFLGHLELIAWFGRVSTTQLIISKCPSPLPPPHSPVILFGMEAHSPALPPADPRAITHYGQHVHERIIELLIARPGIKQGEIAALLGRSSAWISTIMCTDAFKARMAARAGQLVDPMIQDEVKARFEAVARRSLELLQEKLARPVEHIPDSLLLKAVELGAKGYGVGGFSPHPPAAQVSGTAEERLAKLKSNLEGLGSQLAGEIVDVASRDIPPDTRSEAAPPRP